MIRFEHKNLRLAAAAAGLIIIGGVAGLALARFGPGGGDPVATSAGEREVLYWYDPMTPGQRFDKPGKSPFMDMQLVPRYADEEPGAAGVRIDPALVRWWTTMNVTSPWFKRAPAALSNGSMDARPATSSPPALHWPTCWFRTGAEPSSNTSRSGAPMTPP